MMRESERTFLLGMITGAALLGLGLVIGRANTPALALQSPTAATDEKPAVVSLIRAERIEVVDEVGTTQIVLGSNAVGGSLSLRDRLGHTRLAASATRDGAALAISHAATKQRVATLAASPRGGRLSLGDPTGRTTVALRHEPLGGAAIFRHGDGKPALSIGGDDQSPTRVSATSPAGQTIYRLGTDDHDAGLFTLHDPAGGVPLIRLASRAGEAGEITTAHRDGHPLVALAASPDGEGQVFTFDPDGDLLAAIAPIATGSAVRLHDPEGETAITLEIGSEGLPRIGVRGPDGGVRWLTP